MLKSLKIFSFSLLLLICSCVQEKFNSGYQDGHEAILELGFIGNDEISPATKTAGEDEVREFYILAVDATNGQITHRYYFNKEASQNGEVYSDIDLSSNAFAIWHTESSGLSGLRTKQSKVQLVMFASRSDISLLEQLPSLVHCTTLSELEGIVLDCNDTASHMLSGYCEVEGGHTVFDVKEGVNNINGIIRLYPPLSKSNVSITSKDNRFTLVSYKLVDLPSRCYALSSSLGWKDICTDGVEGKESIMSSLLESTSNLDSYTTSTTTSGEILYNFNFFSGERKGMRDMPEFQKETNAITSSRQRYEYARKVLASEGASKLRTSYMQINGVYKEVNGHVLGLKIYIPLGDVSGTGPREDWRNFDIIRGRQYLYNIRINGVNDIETTVADIPGIEYITLVADGTQSFIISPVPAGMDYKVGMDGMWTELTDESFTNGGIDFGGTLGALYLRARGGRGTGQSRISFNNSDVPVSCAGDLRSLVDWYAVGTSASLNLSNVTFTGLFQGNEQLCDVSGLIFPENNNPDVRSYTYASMFEGCVNLEKAPSELPAVNSGEYYYCKMFKNCKKLKAAPTIRLSTLHSFACSEMFRGCTSLTEVQDEWDIKKIYTAGLQRTFAECESLKSAFRNVILEDVASDMACDGTFQGCKSLVDIFDCLPAPLLRSNSYNRMFENCISLVTAPKIKAMYHRDPRNVNSMYRMFAGCKSLVNPPDTLRMISPQMGCYGEMFSGCVSLKVAPVIMADELPDRIKFIDRPTPQNPDPGVEVAYQTIDKEPNKYVFYRMFEGCSIYEIRLPEARLVDNDEVFRPFHNPYWPDADWMTISQNWNISPMMSARKWPSSGTIWVKSEEVKSQLENTSVVSSQSGLTERLIPEGWIVKVIGE